MMPDYVDISVHAFPEGADTPKRLNLVARSLGFTAIGLTAHSPYWSQFSDSNAISGIEIVAHSVRDLRKKIAFFSDTVAVISVHGGDEQINRAACTDDRVDLLMHPERGKRGGLNQVTAKIAEKNGVALGLSFGYFWKTGQVARSRMLAFQHQNVVLCQKFGVPIVITSDAYSHFDLRAPRQLKALARLLPLEDTEATAALSSAPRNIIKRSAQKEEERA
ncbi:MAG: RNase P subunit p30 family protein [Halobacteriota archaeon]|jgi:ribonuclease P/MRP protein subunit RPP1